MVRRNHFVVVSSIFSVLLQPASSDISLLSANILYRSPVPSVSCVFAFPFAEFIMFKYIYHVVPSNKLPFLMAGDPCQRNSNESSYTVFYITVQDQLTTRKQTMLQGMGNILGLQSLYSFVCSYYIWTFEEHTRKQISFTHSFSRCGRRNRLWQGPGIGRCGRKCKLKLWLCRAHSVRGLGLPIPASGTTLSLLGWKRGS